MHASWFACVCLLALAVCTPPTNSQSGGLQWSGGSVGELTEEGEQERIDTMVRAFNRLPSPELERLGVDIKSGPIVQGTSRAEDLKRAWLERQKELKVAMESMTKPAEHMGELARRMKVFVEQGRRQELVGKATTIAVADVDADADSVTDISNALEELESSLSDIDNARDFYTIGGWPVLVSMLSADQHPNHRARAAWAIGTAIKNSYDYQLWVLERQQHGGGGGGGGDDTAKRASCLQLLVDMLDFSHANPEELQRRALYALSSAVRGNADVQEALLVHDDTSPSSLFLNQLTFFAARNFSSPEIPRKVWSLVSDMLQEAAYVRGELAAELAKLPDNSIMHEQMQRLHMLGDHLCSMAWANLASSALRRIGAESLPTAPLRATLVSVLQAVAEMMEQCPADLGVPSNGLPGSSVDIMAVISDQAQKLLINYSASSASSAAAAAPSSSKPKPQGVLLEGENGIEEMFDLEDELDERLVSTYTEEVVGLAQRIISAKKM